jgi:hypothetical protein
MQTPAGKECRYFYGDYYRGREHEECRLLDAHNLDWYPELCETCPVPEIQLANSCENMRFQPSIRRPLFFLKGQVSLKTDCDKCECTVDEPRIGCGQCHALPDVFIVAPDDPDPTT